MITPISTGEAVTYTGGFLCKGRKVPTGHHSTDSGSEDGVMSAISKTSDRCPWVKRWALLLALLAAPRLDASQLRSMGLAEMTQRADRVFSGRCTATEVVRDERIGFNVTHATFEVDRAVKGDVGRTVTVRILGSGAPPFELGERVVLFLYPDSALGLTSPVGLGQGKFSIFKNKEGRDRALNAFGNKNLLRGIQAGTGLSPMALLDEARASLLQETSR